MRHLCRIALLVAPFATSAQSRPPAPSPPVFRLVEDLRIPLDQDQRYGSIFLTIARRGAIVIGQESLFRIRAYDSTGKRVGEFGKQGDQPGEFSGESWGSGRSAARLIAGVVADSVWFYDQGWAPGAKPRVTFATNRGEFLRTMLVQHSDDSLDADALVRVAMTPVAIYGDGAILWRQTYSWRDSSPYTDGGWRKSYRADSAQYVRISADGANQKLVASHRLIPAEVRVGDVRYKPPFADVPQIAIAPDGSRLAVVSIVATSKTGGIARLTVIGAKGDTLFVRELPVSGRPVAPGYADDLVAQIVRNANDGTKRLNAAQLEEFKRKLRAGVPLSRTGVTLMMGVDNSIWVSSWVSSAPAGGSARVWTVLDEKGNPVGTVPYARYSNTSWAVSRNTLWAIEDGIVRYRLVRTQP